MKRLLVVLAILAFWVNSMRQLIVREVAPAVREAAVAAQGVRYTQLREALPTMRRIRMGIYFTGRTGDEPEMRRVGTLLRRIVPVSPQQMEITTTLSVDLGDLFLARALGSGPVNVSMRMVVSNGNLASMEMRIRQMGDGRTWVEVDGRVTGEKLNLTIRAGGDTQHRAIPFDPRYLLDGGISPVTGLPELYVGKRWTVRTFNPLNALRNLRSRIETIQARVTGKETLLWNGQEVSCYVIEIGEGAQRSSMWADLTGRILKYESAALTFLLEPESQEELDDRDRSPDEEVRREDRR